VAGNLGSNARDVSFFVNPIYPIARHLPPPRAGLMQEVATCSSQDSAEWLRILVGRKPPTQAAPAPKYKCRCVYLACCFVAITVMARPLSVWIAITCSPDSTIAKLKLRAPSSGSDVMTFPMPVQSV